MKPGWFIIGLIIPGLLSACSSSSDKTLLQQAEDIYLSAPEQAAKLLDSINPKALSRNERPDYLLLKMHVQYQLKHDITPSRALPRLAEYFRNKGENDKAAWTGFYTGFILEAQGDYAQASICFSEAKDHAEKGQDSCLLFKIHYNMGKLYALKHDQQASREAFAQALNYSPALNHSEDEYLHFEIGSCFLNTGRPSTALTYYKQAETYAIQDRDSLSTARLTYHIGLSYLNTGDKNNAVRYIHKSLHYNKDKTFEAQYNICLANIYLTFNQTDSVAYYLQRIPPEDLSAHDLSASFHATRSRLEEKNGNYHAALIDLQHHNRNLDSLAAEKTEKRIDNIISRHNKRKWQGETHVLIRQRTLLTMSILLLALILILIVTYAVIILRKRKAKYVEANQIIETLQAACRTNDKQQDKFKAILHNQLQISKKLAALSAYPRKDHPSFLKMYNDTLGENSFQLDWKELYLSINYLYDNFQEKLLQKFPNLEEKEVQLCCLLKGGFNNEEIAFFMSKGVSSVHKIKTATRKKLQLEERADIIDELSSIL